MNLKIKCALNLHLAITSKNYFRSFMKLKCKLKILHVNFLTCKVSLNQKLDTDRTLKGHNYNNRNMWRTINNKSQLKTINKFLHCFGRLMIQYVRKEDEDVSAFTSNRYFVSNDFQYNVK